MQALACNVAEHWGEVQRQQTRSAAVSKGVSFFTTWPLELQKMLQIAKLTHLH